MESTSLDCKGCKKHWFNGIGIEMCDNDWNCLGHKSLHRTKDISTITWHSYPEEKPPLDRILISCKGGYIKLVKWSTHNDTFYRDKIDAWAELPEPYKEEK